MKRSLSLNLLVCLSTLGAAESSVENWPSWRGPLSTGVAPKASPPVQWSETSNVKWKVQIPGDGNSSPIVWKDQIFVTTAIPTGKKVVLKTPPAGTTEPKPAPTGAAAQASGGPGDPKKPGTEPGAAQARNRAGAQGGGGGTGGGGGGGSGGRAQVEQPDEEQQFVLFALDRATGKTQWKQIVRTELPHEGHHKDHGYASASPVTDGEVVIAYFGSRGLYAFDLQGKLLWQRDFGHQQTRNGFGEGSSPALHGNAVIVVWDHEGEDFIVALDKRTGKDLWRKPREESTNWTTPVVINHGGVSQIVVNSGNKVRSYGLETGETIWEDGGQTQNAVPAPVADDKRVYVMSGWRGGALHAIQLGRRGDLTGTDAVAWQHNKGTPYVPSPLLYGGKLYFFSGNNAQLSILETADGAVKLDAERLDGIFGVYASPVGAADRVYLTGRNGVVWVIKNSSSLEVLSKNKLDDAFDATPAVVGNELILRGHQNLYALAEASPSKQ
jgi:outer membrane protein assembly factor BamB